MAGTTHQHLDDDRLIEAVLGARELSRVAGHVAGLEWTTDCEACRARYLRFAAAIDGLVSAATAEAEAQITDERMTRQRTEILRRLEEVRGPARILRFPGSEGHFSGRDDNVRRWVAVAAAAGLLVGILTGSLVELRPLFPLGVSGRVAAGRARSAVQGLPEPGTVIQLPAMHEEQLLGEIEAALSPRPVAELEALDALTPHVTDIIAAR